MTAEFSAASRLTSVKKKNIRSSCEVVFVRGVANTYFFSFFFSAEDSFRKIAVGKAAHTEKKKSSGGDRSVCFLACLLQATLMWRCRMD